MTAPAPEKSLFPFQRLFQETSERLPIEVPGVVVAYGRREPAKQSNQGRGRANRVLFVADDDGKFGEFKPPRHAARNPRAIATIVRRGRVYVWGFDGEAPQDELRQDDAAERLLHATVRAIRASAVAIGASGPLEFGDPERVGEVVERTFGVELFFTLGVESAVFAAARPVAPKPLTATFTDELVFVVPETPASP